MKKKIFGALVVVAIAVGAMINVNLNKVSNKGDLALANVEALADFEFNDTKWNTTDTHSWGKDWLPVIINCTITIGMAPYQNAYQGRGVACYNGNGNCLVGTLCHLE